MLTDDGREFRAKTFREMDEGDSARSIGSSAADGRRPTAAWRTGSVPEAAPGVRLPDTASVRLPCRSDKEHAEELDDRTSDIPVTDGVKHSTDYNDEDQRSGTQLTLPRGG